MAAPNYNPQIKTRRSAFTLVELLIALTITALVGATTVSMLSAMSNGTDANRTVRELLVKTKMIDGRIRSAVRGSVEVIDSSNDHLILWKADENDDDAKQNNEVQLIERNSATNELHSYQNSADTNGFSTAAAFRSNAIATYTSQRWATDVTASAITVTTTPAGSKALVSFRITVNSGSANETAIGAAALRESP